MPLLNLNKCYTQQKQRLTITVPETLPDDWLTEFYTLLSKQLKLNDETKQEYFDHNTNKVIFLTDKERFFKELDRHVGEQSTYSLKRRLIESLATLYSLFKHQNTTYEQKHLIASRIAEDVSQCSPGFTNRVNYVISRFNNPQNMDELIAQVRFNLVDRIASIIAAKNTQGIHVHNRVIEVARGAGFGVWPINTDDLYLGTGSDDLSDETIIKTVQTGFNNHFQLFALVNALSEQIEALIASHGYQGKRELNTGYLFKEYEPFIECIKRFIPIETEALFELNEQSNKIININWRYVKRALLHQLRADDYVTLSKEEAALFDGDEQNLTPLIPHGYELAQCLEFYSEWRMEQKEALVLAYLKNKSPKEQIEELTILHNEAPLLTAQLKKEPSLQAMYFAIAVAENDIKAVRAYVEQGADINAALPLLFSEAHKSDTLYWLYEQPNLLQQMTAKDVNTVLSQSKYQGKTVAETLLATKKGRQLVLEHEVLQKLFSQTTLANTLSNYLKQAQTERSTVNTKEGFFKKPNPLANQLVQFIVYGELNKSEELLKANPSLLKTLLTEKVTVTDYSRRKVKQKTAFQATLCAMDDELRGMLAKYMTKEEMTCQYQAIFPQGHETYFKAQTPFDFSHIVATISNSSDDDVKKALSLELPNNTKLWGELQQFRSDFTKRSYQETVFNPQHLIKAFELYDSQFEKWNWDQRDLFWRQVIGYVQRFLPANIAMDFAQGLYDRVENKEKSKRSFKFTYGAGSIFPLAFDCLSGLGYEYGSGRVGVVGGGVRAVCAGGRAGAVITKLMSSKNSELGRIMRPESNCSHPRWCIIQ